MQQLIMLLTSFLLGYMDSQSSWLDSIQSRSGSPTFNPTPCLLQARTRPAPAVTRPSSSIKSPSRTRVKIGLKRRVGIDQVGRSPLLPHSLLRRECWLGSILGPTSVDVLSPIGQTICLSAQGVPPPTTSNVVVPQHRSLTAVRPLCPFQTAASKCTATY
jgi:hypothetical protein